MLYKKSFLRFLLAINLDQLQSFTELNFLNQGYCPTSSEWMAPHNLDITFYFHQAQFHLKRSVENFVGLLDYYHPPTLPLAHSPTRDSSELVRNESIELGDGNKVTCR